MARPSGNVTNGASHRWTETSAKRRPTNAGASSASNDVGARTQCAASSGESSPAITDTTAWPAGPQHAVRGAQGGERVRQEVEHVEGGDRVQHLGPERQPRGVALHRGRRV